MFRRYYICKCQSFAMKWKQRYPNSLFHNWTQSVYHMLLPLQRLIREREYGVMAHGDLWAALRTVSATLYLRIDFGKTRKYRISNWFIISRENICKGTIYAENIDRVHGAAFSTYLGFYKVRNNADLTFTLYMHYCYFGNKPKKIEILNRIKKW